MFAVLPLLALLATAPSAAAVTAVSGVTATAGNNQVALSWTNPPDADFDHVNVYRATSKYGTLALVQTVASPGASWTDTTAVNGTDYWYVLRAATVADVEAPDAVAGGLVSSWFTSTAFTTMAGQKFDATIDYPSTTGPNPFGQTTSFGARWDGYLYAPTSETYTIYSTKDDSTRMWIDGALVMNQGCCGETSFAIALSAGWHTLRVELDQGSGGWQQTVSWSTPTLTKEVIPSSNLGTELRFQATPRNNTLAVSAPNGSETITTPATNVTWTSTGTVDHFDISYSLDSGSTWGGTVRSYVPSSATSQEWLLPPGVTDSEVRIRVRALSANGIVLASDTSNADFAIDTPPVAPVSGIVATPGNGSVTLTWTNPTDPQFDHVDIYRASNEFDVGTLVHSTSLPSTSSWADATVVNGTEYWYRIRAVDSAGRSSPDITAGQANARWYNGTNLDTYLGTATSTCLCDSFGNSDGPGPLPESPDYMYWDSFSGRYSGWFFAETSGSYHFRAYRRSGARIWVDGTQLMNEWNVNNTLYDTASAAISLTAGWHPIRFEYVTSGSDSHVHFFHKLTSSPSWQNFSADNLGMETTANAVPHSTAVSLTAPNGGQQFRAERHETISWSTTGGEASAVDLWYSTDGGATYPYLIVRDRPLTGSYAWLVPNGLSSAQVRIRAVARTGPRTVIDTDDSDADLLVDTASAPPDDIQSLVVTPGNASATLQWTMPSPIGTVDHVRIYRIDSAGAVPLLVHETADAVTTGWTDVGLTNGQVYRYMVRTVDAAGREQVGRTVGRVNAEYYDGQSYNVFKGRAVESVGYEGGRGYGVADSLGPIAFESPDWIDSNRWSVRYEGWINAPETSTYRLRVYRDGGARLTVDGKLLMDEWYTGNNNDYDASYIPIQLNAGWHHYQLEYTTYDGDAFVYFQHLRPAAWAWDDFDSLEVAATRVAAVTPTDVTVNLDAPNGGELLAGQSFTDVQWTTTGTAASVDLWYSTDGGATFPYLIVRGQPTTGAYPWLPPDGVQSSQVRLRAVARAGGGERLAQDESDADLSIDTLSPAPSPVTAVQAVAGDGQVDVSWTMPSPLGSVDHVEVYRLDADGVVPQRVHVTANATTTSWTDTTVVNGTTYRYFVRTVDLGGRQGLALTTGQVDAEYYDGQSFNTFKGNQVENVGFEGGRGFGSPDSPGPVPEHAPDWLDPNRWSTRYQGWFQVPETSVYRLRVYRDGGARLWVDGRSVLDEWYTGNNNDYDSNMIQVQLSAGWHQYRLEYTTYDGDAFVYFQHIRPTAWAWADVQSADVAVELHDRATPTAATATLTSPDGGQDWRAQRYEQVTWTSTNAASAILHYSLDGGATWPYVIARNLPASGSFDWLLPDDVQSTQVRVRVTAVDGAGVPLARDASNADLAIDTQTPPPPPVTDLSATAGDSSATVTWTMPSPLGGTDHVAIYRLDAGSVHWRLVHETANATTTSWTDTGLTNASTYRYSVHTVDASGREQPGRVGGLVDAEYYDGQSHNVLKARLVESVGFENGRGFGTPDSPGPVEEQAPDWLDPNRWSTRHEGWFQVPETSAYRLRVYRDGGARLWVDGRVVMDEWYTGNNNDYDASTIQVQLNAGWHRYRLEYTTYDGDAFFYYQNIRPSAWAWADVSSGTVANDQSVAVTPTSANVTLTTPNGGEDWRAERLRTVAWTTAGSVSHVDLWYSTDAGATFPYLIARGQPASGSYEWRVPNELQSSQVRVQARAMTGAWTTLATDASDADLAIDTVSPPPPPVQAVRVLQGNAEATVIWTMPSPLGSTDHVAVYRSVADGPLEHVHDTADAVTTTWTDTGLVNGQSYRYVVRTVDAGGREQPALLAGRVRSSYYSGQNHDTHLYSTVEGYGFESGWGFGSTDFPLSPQLPGEAPSPNRWSSKHSGWLYTPETSAYRLRVYRDGGARLWIDGRQVLNEWYTGNNNDYDASTIQVQLTKGWHEYRLDYTTYDGDAFFYFQSIRPSSWAWADFDTPKVAVERSAVAIPNVEVLELTSPNGGEQWSSALDRTITWNASGMPVGTTYRIRYSLDGGANWERIIAQGLANTSMEWHVPEGIDTDAAMIRVEAIAVSGALIAHDDSNATFSIHAPALAPVSNLSATPGWSQVELSWTNPVSASFDHVNVYRTQQPWLLGTKVATVAAPTNTWTDTSVTNGQRYWYVVRAADASDEEAMTLQVGGLRGDYFDGADFGTYVGSQVDPTIDFNWGAGGPALLGGTSDNFSIRWTGYLRADVDAFWTLDNNRPTRDGTRLWVDDQRLINRWNAGDTDSAGTSYMQLQDGWHRITVEYHETTGNAYTALYHARTGLARRVVPSSELATERRAMAVPIDPNPPMPNPAGTVTAISPTEIEWSMMTVVDAESGLHATPYSYDNGSTWVSGSTYSRTGLSPNTSYTQTLRARDATGNMTTPNVLTARTLAVAPSVVASHPTSTWLGPGSQTITFSSTAVFGSGGVAYYRWAFNGNGAHTFDESEPQWTSGNLVRNVATSGIYYLHARSYNADDVPSGQVTIGPFWIDAEAPAPNPPTVSTSSTLSSVTFSVGAVTDDHSGLPAAPYSFDNGVAWGSSTSDAATGLAANTEVTRTIVVRDAIGNLSTPQAVTAATLPVDPGVTSVPVGGAAWHPGGVTINLTSTVAFGPGTLWGYRWRLTTNAGDAVLDTDTAWTSGTEAVPIPTTGDWYIRARSYNSTGTGGNTITLGPFHVDATPPPGTVPSAPSPTAVAPVLTWSAVTDSESGLSGYRVYRSTTSGVLGSQVASVAGTTYTDSDPLVDDTTYYYTVQAVDNVANEQTVGNTQVAVTYSSAPPTGSTVTIAGGAGAVATDAVTLSLASANAAQMQVSNAPDFSGATWEPFSATRGWTLAAGADGNRSVYARFRNAGGTVSSAVVDTIDLDTTAPTPDPPTGTGTAGSATAITWTISAVSDNIVGLPADPYSFDDGATWQSGTGLSETSLAPNTQYTKLLRARDALGNVTAQGTVDATTHAAAPSVSSSPAPDPLAQPRGTTFTFTNLAGWGAGAVEYYRWAWTTSATHAFAGTEPIWNAGTLAHQEFVAGIYYFHVQAYNAEDVAGQALTLGSYEVAPPQNDTELNLNIASTQTIDCTTTDFTLSLLPGDSDDATIACDVTSSLAGWRLDVHAAAAPFFTGFVDVGAAPGAYAPPAATDAQVAFTASGTYSDPAFANGTLWRGFAGATDIQIGTDTGTAAAETVTTLVRAELGSSASVAPGTRSQTVTFTLNPSP